MEVIWTGAAKHKQREIILHIAESDADAALKLLDIFETGAKKLEKYPALGSAGKIRGTRELQVHKHYFLVYEVSEEKIYILALWQTSQQYPNNRKIWFGFCHQDMERQSEFRAIRRKRPTSPADGNYYFNIFQNFL